MVLSYFLGCVFFQRADLRSHEATVLLIVKISLKFVIAMSCVPLCCQNKESLLCFSLVIVFAIFQGMLLSTKSSSRRLAQQIFVNIVLHENKLMVKQTLSHVFSSH